MAVATKLLIVDDHPGFRQFARLMLAAEGFEVTGAVSDGECVLGAVLEQHPDVVLLDVQLPGIDGFEVADQLAATASPPKVVLTSSRSASDYGTRLTRAPARGFIPKQDVSGATIAALASA
jgi:DNA-binding NarL/FixJ family response regulator